MRETLQENRPGAPGYSRDLIPPQLAKSASISNLNSRKLDVLDIGCGGGLLSESMARLPFVRKVLGVDVTPEVIEVAKQHLEQDPKLNNLTYSVQGVETLDSQTQQFDVVTMYEVLEHLDQPRSGLDTAMALVKPGGWLFLSTINRTIASYLSTIFVGEHLLNIVPPGTHTWSKYINADEIKDHVECTYGSCWQVARTQGCIYMPSMGWVRFDPTSRGPLGILNCAIGQTGGNYVMALHRSENSS